MFELLFYSNYRKLIYSISCRSIRLGSSDSSASDSASSYSSSSSSSSHNGRSHNTSRSRDKIVSERKSSSKKGTHHKQTQNFRKQRLKKFWIFYSQLKHRKNVHHLQSMENRSMRETARVNRTHLLPTQRKPHDARSFSSSYEPLKMPSPVNDLSSIKRFFYTFSNLILHIWLKIVG